MHSPTDRVTEHAKLLKHENRQVLAYLYRDDEDALCVALQLWSRAHDEQIRAVIRTETDEEAIIFFASLDEDTLPAVIEHSGVLGLLRTLEEALA